MSIVSPVSKVRVVVSGTAEAAGAAAGQAAADVMVRVLEERSQVRVVFASAPSQEQMLATLAADPRIDWSRVESLHMDDYLGIAPDHPAAFANWLVERLPPAAAGGFERMRPDSDPEAEIRRYSDLLAKSPIDLVCLGIGVNGHIAFNEPGDTDFNTSALVRTVSLTHASRQQQVDEGLFDSLDDVPTHALTLTVPAMVAGRSLVCTVLGPAKAEAVAASLSGPIDEAVPASALLGHPNATVYLDSAAAEHLPDHIHTAVQN